MRDSARPPAETRAIAPRVTGCIASEPPLDPPHDIVPAKRIFRMNLPSQATANPGGRSNAMAAFAAVTVLFFAWGFITSLIDPLVAAVKGIFTLSDAEIGRASCRERVCQSV